MAKVETNTEARACSFCGRPHAEVRRLIAGPGGVSICDGCVGVCNELIAKHQGEEPAGASG